MLPIAELRGSDGPPPVASSPVRLTDPFRHAMRRLLRWHRTHGRIYPWRQTSDRYRLTVTELMLVRTRADTVASVWPKFFSAFPTLDDLAASEATRVMAILRPLGLRWRAERILAFARAAAQRDCRGSLTGLPGAGTYVDAAVSVGAFGRGRLPVDVTIARALTRYFGITPTTEPRRDKTVNRAVDAMGTRSRRFFHAWLDLAALVCLPRAPHCRACPLAQSCAYASRLPTGADEHNSRGARSHWLKEPAPP